jgi:hypothetical protein
VSLLDYTIEICFAKYSTFYIIFLGYGDHCGVGDSVLERCYSVDGSCFGGENSVIPSLFLLSSCNNYILHFYNDGCE